MKRESKTPGEFKVMKTNCEFPEWFELIEYLGYTRKTIWRILGYSSQNIYDSGLSRMKKNGILDRKFKFAILVFRVVKENMQKKLSKKEKIILKLQNELREIKENKV